MNNIVDALLSVVPAPGIKLRSVREGDHKTTCPACSHTRKKKTDPCLSVTLAYDGGDMKAVWKCHHCGWSGWTGTGRLAKIRGAERKVYRRPTIKPVPPQKAVLEWLGSRCIPEHIVAREKVFAAQVWMPQSEQVETVVAFPFFRNGEITNVKYREPIKKWFRQEKDAEPLPYGYDSLVGAKTITVCEGEIDRLSFLVVGVEACISAPDGAPEKDLPSDSPKMAWMDACAEHFEAADRVIIATDADAPGRALARETIRRVGRHKAWMIQWPVIDGTQINDANQMLMVAGEEELRRLHDSPIPVPVEGEVTIDDLWGEIEAMHRGRSIEWASAGFDGALDEIYRVVRGQVTVVTGLPNEGKALAVDTPIPTPSGFTTMGAIRVGDWVYGADGQPRRVTHATDVMEGRPCFRVTFSDGASIIADADHQWFTASKRERVSMAAQERRRPDTAPRGTDQRDKALVASVRTTAEMAQAPLRQDGGPNWAVPLPPALSGFEAALPVPPYTMGAWLGDGSANDGVITSFDAEVIAGIEAEGFSVKERAATPGRFGVQGLKVKLRAAGVLGDKHIPSIYMLASTDQRMAMLRGLVDTDGHVGKAGQVEIVCCSPRLADGIVDLIRSLGFITGGAKEGRAMLNGRDCGPKWRITFRPGLPVATIARKVAPLMARSLKKRWRVIRSIEPVESVPVRCISVASPDRLFLAGREMIVTHNSTFVDNMMVNMALGSAWKFAIFSPENDPARHAVNLLEKAARAPFFDGPSPRMGLDEVRSYRAWLSQHFHFLKFDRQASGKKRRADVDWIIAMIEYQVRRYGIDGAVVDPYNRVAKPAGLVGSENDFVLDLLDALQSCAQRNSIHIWVVAHPTKMPRGKDGKRTDDALSLQDVSGGHAWDAATDMGFSIRRVWKNKVTGDAYKPRETPVEFTTLKARDRFAGQKGASAMFKFDFATGRYIPWQGPSGEAYGEDANWQGV